MPSLQSSNWSNHKKEFLGFLGMALANDNWYQRSKNMVSDSETEMVQAEAHLGGEREAREKFRS